MSSLNARAAARVIGAAVTAGAVPVSPAELLEAALSSGPRSPAPDELPAAAHLVAHFVGEDPAAPLLLGAAEWEQGLRGTYLLPLHAENHATAVVVAQALRRMGHHIGAWIRRDAIAQADAALASLREALDTASLPSLQVLGVPAPPAAEAAGESEDGLAGTLGTLCERSEIPCWVAGHRFGARGAGVTLFHVSDSPAGWTLDCTAGPYRVTAAAPGDLTAHLLAVMCDFAARGSCLYTLATDLYGAS